MTIRVLLVDDVPEMRTMLRVLLRRQVGVEVVAEAATGLEAVELAAQHQPDVVILDLGLPDLDGHDVLSGIRNRAPAVRVVVFSGTRFAARGEIAARAEGFVTKDQDLGILLDALTVAGQEQVEVRAFAITQAAESVAQARHITRATLSEWGLSAMLPDAQLVVSELVTNAIVHAQTPSVLRLSKHPTSVRVAVLDHDAGTPEPRAPSPSRLHGRGLQIVNSLSAAWGVDNLGGTKLVWAELPRGEG